MEFRIEREKPFVFLNKGRMQIIREQLPIHISKNAQLLYVGLMEVEDQKYETDLFEWMDEYAGLTEKEVIAAVNDLIQIQILTFTTEIETGHQFLSEYVQIGNDEKDFLPRLYFANSKEEFQNRGFKFEDGTFSFQKPKIGNRISK